MAFQAMQEEWSPLVQYWCLSILGNVLHIIDCFFFIQASLIVFYLQKDLVPDDYDRRDPEHKTIYRFIRTLFNAAQLTAECAIVTLVGHQDFF